MWYVILSSETLKNYTSHLALRLIISSMTLVHKIINYLGEYRQTSVTE